MCCCCLLFCDVQGNELTVSPKGIFVGVVCRVSLGVFVLTWSTLFASSVNKN